MNTKIWAALLFGCFLSQGCSGQGGRLPATGNNTKQAGIAIVELFTSEGCSSCPPADALMPVLKSEFKDNVIVLSFHVDYWNRLGWKDPYSNSDYSKRQNQYSSAFGSDNVYTPQAIVNGTDQTTGGNQQGLSALIKKAAAKPSAANIEVTARHEKDGEAIVTYKTRIQANEVVNLALVQIHASTDVQRGENGGRTLKHYNVVRDFRSLQKADGEVRFTLPGNMSADQFRIVAFIQNAQNKHILAGREVAIDYTNQ